MDPTRFDDDTITATRSSITAFPYAHQTVVRLRGEIDEALREQASRTLATAVQRGLPIVLDTREVTFMDSTGIAFLIQCTRCGREQGVPVHLPDPPAVVRELVRLVGASHLFA